jgi:predicted permease
MSLIRASRGLARTPGSTVACIATLSLGIAAATAMFTLLDSLLLRPLPYQEPDRLAAIEPRVSWRDILDIEAHAKTVAAAGVYIKRTWGFTDASRAPVEVVLAGMVTHGFFDALRVKPVLGTAFTADEEQPGANRVLWLTHDFWRSRYNGRAGVLGSAVELNDVKYRVAGVLPAGFRFPMDGENPDVYIPLDRVDYCCRQEARTLSGIARLAPRIARTAAAAELSTIASTKFDLTSLQSALLGGRRGPLLFLGLVSALLMLLAATNAAAILLARTARNLRDAAIKASLGAELKHLLVEHALEGVAIAVAAAASGLLLGFLAIRAARVVPALAATLDAYGKIAELRVDSRVAAFAVLVALLAAVAAALVPVILLRRAWLEQLLREGVSGARRTVLGRNLLVAAQIAISSILLCAGALIFDHLREVLKADRGFRTEQIVIAGIGIPESRYDTDPKMIDFHERVIDRLRAIPGVVEAGGGTGLPFGRRTQFLPRGQDLPKKDRPWAVIGVASPAVLPLLGISVSAGRGFTAQDRYGHPYVALVNRKFTERYGEGIGARLRVGFWNGNMKPWTEFEVVGVVADARNRDIDLGPEPAIYLSALQVPMEGFLYFVRTSLPASNLTQAFRQAVWSEDPNLQRVTPRPLAPYIERNLESRRLAVWLIGFFAGLGLLLATTGLGASMSAWVTESRAEIGIRSALGEPSSSIVRRVLARSMRIAGAGMLAAIPGTFAAVSVLRNQIPGIGDLRATPACIVAAFVAIAAVLASVIPAQRAARLNPMDVLRH